MKRHFSKEQIQMSNKHEKILNITYHQGNAIQSHDEISPHQSQNDSYQNVNKRYVLVRMWKKGTCTFSLPLWKTLWRFFKKLKVDLPYNLAIPFLGIYPKKTKALIKKDVYTPMFTVALFITTKIWKQTRCPSIYEKIKKIKYYIAMKRNKILPFVTIWMDLKATMLSETSQTVKDKYHMVSYICAI